MYLFHPRIWLTLGNEREFSSQASELSFSVPKKETLKYHLPKICINFEPGHEKRDLRT